MKKILFLFFLLLLHFNHAQIVKGTVFNEVNKPIPQVNVYIDGTKTGAISNSDGSFSLDISNVKNGNLVFQKEDYDTYSINLSEKIENTLRIVLLKTKDIEEVKIIPYTEAAYQNFIKYFLDVFIGMDQENVKIKNQRSLKFSYDKANKILKVKAPQTLQIENKNLGFKIDFNLVDFTSDFNSKTTRFIGTSFFKETNNRDKIKVNRMNAFEGSQDHFFRSVYANRVAEEGYTVNQITKLPNPKYPTEQELQRLKEYASNLKSNLIANFSSDLSDIAKRKNNEKPYVLAITKTNIPTTDFTHKTDEKLILKYDYILQIIYKKYYFELKKGNIVKSDIPIIQTSFLYPESNFFEIYKSGNVSNPWDLTNQGEFTNFKIEKLLPLDYVLGE